jgi:hypothetical protein
MRSRASSFSQAPNLAKPSLLAVFTPGATKSSGGSLSSASQARSSCMFASRAARRKVSGRFGTLFPISTSVSERYSSSSWSLRSTLKTVWNQLRVCSRQAFSPGSVVSPCPWKTTPWRSANSCRPFQKSSLLRACDLPWLW